MKRGPPSKAPASSTAYWDASRRPMQVLALVAPLCIAYEILLAVGLRGVDGSVLTNRAHEGILRLFGAFGVDGVLVGLPALSIPAIAVVVVLVLWQVLAREPWTVSPWVWLGTVAESCLTAIPLYVAARATGLAMSAMALSVVGAATQDGSTDIVSLGWDARLGLSLGAGIYEELVFRLGLVSLLHAVLRDALRAPDAWATWAAVGVAAIAFVLYHPIRLQSGAIDWRAVVFLGLAGLWFGVLFVTRGFGIAVGAHAAYDILALSTAGSLAS